MGRLYERLNLSIEANYEITTRPKNVKKVACRNVSASGACITTTEKLTPETKINVAFQAPEASLKNHKIPAKVVWARRIESLQEGASNVSYDTGLCFTEPKPILIGSLIECFSS